MTDMQTICFMLDRTNISYRIESGPPRNPSFKRTEFKVYVHEGYQCHFEAEFDIDQVLLSIGQFDEM